MRYGMPGLAFVSSAHAGGSARGSLRMPRQPRTGFSGSNPAVANPASTGTVSSGVAGDTEPDTAVSSVESVEVDAPLRTLSMNPALTILAVIALVAALYLGRGFFVPLLIGILASYALHPVVDRLEAYRVPRAVGAALVLALLVGSLIWIGVTISDDTTAMIERLPNAARKLRQQLSAARLGTPTALQNMQEAAQEAPGRR